ALEPYAVLDGPGEVFVSRERLQPWQHERQPYRNAVLVVRAAKGSSISGRLFVPNADWSGMVALKFKLDSASQKSDSKQEFLKIKENHYGELRERNIPGGAWFRHQESETAKERGSSVVPARMGPPSRFGGGRPWDDSYDGTYELFSGGRALSENLQLDRVLAAPGSNTALVA